MLLRVEKSNIGMVYIYVGYHNIQYQPIKMVRLVNWFLDGQTKERYMQNGFTEEEAKAMAWICRQKAEGKFWGATSGLFLALTWGHYHHRILNYFRLSFNPRLTQLGIIMGSILFFDHLFTGNRRGANELYANYLLLNNNLFLSNIRSIVDNFDIFTRTFTNEEITAFNFRQKLVRTNHHEIKNKKWIYNPAVYTPEQFQKRIKMASEAPWSDIKQYSSKYGKAVISSPTNIGKLIDETGDRLGITQNFVFGWSPIH